MTIRFVVTISLVAVLAGCSTIGALPQARESDLGQAMPRIEPGATPILSWHGECDDLRTYWGRQTVTVQADVWFPPVWRQPGDERWRVTAVTGQGVRLPFIGVVRPYASEKGRTLAELWPPLDLDRAPDGLYVIIYPNITADANGKAVSVAPVAAVREIRGHSFKPFEVKAPLIPAEESPLTPRPDWTPPKAPEGTPIPAN